MSRVINIDSFGKDRNRLIKAIVLCIRELGRQSQVTAEARDLAAFIALALKAISGGIDASVTAWEKRDYWVKADRFRMEWSWAGSTSDTMKAAVLKDDWAAIALIIPKIASRLGKVQVSSGHRLGKPWTGAYDQLKISQ